MRCLTVDISCSVVNGCEQTQAVVWGSTVCFGTQSGSICCVEKAHNPHRLMFTGWALRCVSAVTSHRAHTWIWADGNPFKSALSTSANMSRKWGEIQHTPNFLCDLSHLSTCNSLSRVGISVWTSQKKGSMMRRIKIRQKSFPSFWV